MTVAEVHKQIVEKRLNNVYIFTGEELEVRSQYIHKIAEIANLDIVVCDAFSEIVSKLRNNSIIAKNYCYVIWEDKEFQTVEDGWKKIQSLVGNNIVIFVYNSIDKRLKFYKQNKEHITEFERLQPAVLLKYVQKHISLSEKNANRLIEICENDYSRILLEIDKILTFQCVAEADGYDADCNEAFEMLLKDKIIYQPPKDAIFDFVDAVLTRNMNRAYDYLDNCKRIGESALALLSVLYNNAKQILQVQTYTGKDVVGATGLTAWQVKCANAKKGKYSVGELISLMRRTRDAEVGIKTGAIEEDFAMDYLLVNTF